MNRVFILAILIVGSFGTASYAVIATFTEDFNSPTLNSQLYTSVSSPSYSIGPLTPGATWKMSKQAGTSVGSAEIHTGFEVFGDFVADLTVDSSSIGTGEVGMRFGDGTRTTASRWAELFFDGPRDVSNIFFFGGGYGRAGITTDSKIVLRLSRTGDTFDFYANGQHFAQAPSTQVSGPAYMTIFLRPYSGGGSGDSTAGNPDAHTAVLDKFTILANGFVVPEPSSLALMVSAMLFGCTRRRRNCA